MLAFKVDQNDDHQSNGKSGGDSSGASNEVLLAKNADLLLRVEKLEGELQRQRDSSTKLLLDLAEEKRIGERQKNMHTRDLEDWRAEREALNKKIKALGETEKDTFHKDVRDSVCKKICDADLADLIDNDKKIEFLEKALRLDGELEEQAKEEDSTAKSPLFGGPIMRHY